MGHFSSTSPRDHEHETSRLPGEKVVIAACSMMSTSLVSSFSGEGLTPMSGGQDHRVTREKHTRFPAMHTDPEGSFRDHLYDILSHALHWMVSGASILHLISFPERGERKR